MVLWRAMPTPFFQEMFESGAVRMLSIDQGLVAGLRMNQPFLTSVTIPPGVYPNQPKSISTVAVKSMLVASRSVEAHVVTQILEVLFSSIPDLIAHHPRAGDISLEHAYRLEDGMPIDLHPGAVAFYAADR
jgi:TRAP transporter TAXI family solute receptor